MKVFLSLSVSLSQWVVQPWNFLIGNIGLFFMKIDHQFCRREKGPEFRALACVRWSSCFSAGCWQSCCLFSTRSQWAGELHEFPSLFNAHLKFLTFFWDLTTLMVIQVFGCYLLCFALCFSCDFDRCQPVWLIWSLICSFCKFNRESFGIWDEVLLGRKNAFDYCSFMSFLFVQSSESILIRFMESLSSLNLKAYTHLFSA